LRTPFAFLKTRLRIYEPVPPFAGFRAGRALAVARLRGSWVAPRLHAAVESAGPALGLVTESPARLRGVRRAAPTATPRPRCGGRSSDPVGRGANRASRTRVHSRFPCSRRTMISVRTTIQRSPTLKQIGSAVPSGSLGNDAGRRRESHLVPWSA